MNSAQVSAQEALAWAQSVNEQNAQQTEPASQQTVTTEPIANSPQESSAMSWAQSVIGKQNPNPSPLDDTAVARAQNDTGDQSYDNFCETFAEQLAYGHAGLYPTAADAWQNYVQQGVAQTGDVAKAPYGAMIYFAPDSSNSGEGHVGFSDGQGNLVSATSFGVKSIPVNQWIQSTGQKPLGFVIPPANPAPNQVSYGN